MKKNPMHLRPLSLLILALGLVLMSMGCDHVTPSEEAPSGEIAAAMAASSQSAATVDQNLELVELFAAPMASSVEDLGLDGETDFDPWSGEGANFPELAMLGAQGFRGTANLQISAARSVSAGRKATMELPDIEWGGMDRAEGDTLSVEYFNEPDSTGLNALIEGAEPEMIRFVVIRDYPNAGPLQPNHRESEILIDTQGTLEDNSDDELLRVDMSEAWANGQVITGSIAPESGSGPLLPDAVVIATHRIDDPMWHPLQSWFESVVRLEAGDFELDGDEVFHSFVNTVRWINDAEETVSIVAADEGAIEDDSEVVVVAEFTAAPANGWLESVRDEIHANMGDLDDEADDLLLSIARASIFDGVDYEGNSPRASISFTPEQPVAVGEEPCGGDLEEAVYYQASWWVWSVERQVDIGCDGSGTVHVHMEFANGSSLDRNITWDGGVATLSESRPDGTEVEGSWNEDTGDYAVTTTFPAGSDPEQRIQSGNFTDGHMDARDEFIWMDEHDDYTEFSADETEAGWNITGIRVDGALNESFTLSGSDGELGGTWSREDEGVDASGSFTLTELAGGGAHLIFDARDILAEGEPQVTGDLWYEPDGSGHGTVTITQFGNTTTYDIEWSADGEGSLTDGQGNTVPLG